MYIVGPEAKGITQKAITLRPAMTLMDARNTMMKYNISRVVVAKGRTPVGILTEKDIVRFLYSEVPSRRLDEITVDEIMSKNLVTVEEEFDLTKCAKLMLEKGISSLIVVDGRKNLKGIFTKSDLVYAYVENFAGEHLIREFMTKRVLTVAPDETIHMAILLMNNSKVSRIVVAKDNRPIGLITGRDLLPVSAVFGTGTFGSYWTVRKDLIAQRRKQAYIPSGIKAIFIASDVMTPNPLTIHQDADLADAGYIMLRNRISGLPVVDSNDKMTGIITKTDIIRALASHASDGAMKAQTGKNDIYTSILLIAKSGASKKEIAGALSISGQQLRRLTAELVDRGMLRLDGKAGILLTTDKGHIFLRNKKVRDAQKEK